MNRHVRAMKDALQIKSVRLWNLLSAAHSHVIITKEDSVETPFRVGLKGITTVVTYSCHDHN